MFIKYNTNVNELNSNDFDDYFEISLNCVSTVESFNIMRKFLNVEIDLHLRGNKNA